LRDLEKRREVFQILPQNTLLKNNNIIFGNQLQLLFLWSACELQKALFKEVGLRASPLFTHFTTWYPKSND
jgi:hypothetical protein